MLAHFNRGFVICLAGKVPRDYWFPEIRSLGGAILVMASVLYPYILYGDANCLSIDTGKPV
jgi:hypothetical protein